MIAQTLIVGLALEQLLDGFTQLLCIHRCLTAASVEEITAKGASARTLANDRGVDFVGDWRSQQLAGWPCPKRHTSSARRGRGYRRRWARAATAPGAAQHFDARSGEAQRLRAEPKGGETVALTVALDGARGAVDDRE